MKEENCRLGRKRHNPVSSNHVRASSNVNCPASVLAHPFGARCFQLFRCQRKTSLPGWQSQPATRAPESAAATFQVRWVSNGPISGGRPAGFPSKNTAKLLDVHAGNWLGGWSSQVLTITILYVLDQEAVFTLMAEWQAMEAAMRVRSLLSSSFRDGSSESAADCSMTSASVRSSSAPSRPTGAALTASV